MRVIFQTNQLSELGTEVALYDYAHYNEEFLGNESYILTKVKHHFPHNEKIINKFKDRFNSRVFFYENWKHAEEIIKDCNIDVLYTIKAGVKDQVLSKNVKTCVHAVFQMFEPHGDVYAYVSKWLSNKMTGGEYPYVPHMINLPDVKGDMREQLNIPKDAIVFGRYGNINSFNLPFTVNAVNRIVDERDDMYFVFVNTRQKSPECGVGLKSHKQIILLPAITDLNEKVKYINTCDALLHARLNGESFGITIGEFSIKNKPVLTWSGNNAQKYYRHKHDYAHLQILGDKGIVYNDDNVYEIINKFKPDSTKNWDAYSESYSPLVVMEKFNNVFLK